MACTVSHVDLLKERIDSALRRPATCKPNWERDVFRHGQIVEEVKKLKYKPHVLAANLR
jgi:hypothetical protein